MRMPEAALTVLFVIATWNCAPPARAAVLHAPAAREDLSREARDSLSGSVRSLRLQTELPSDSFVAAPGAPLPSAESPSESGTDASASLEEWAPLPQKTLRNRTGTLSRVAGYAFWGALAAIAVAVVLSLRDNLWSFSRSQKLTRPVGAVVIDSAPEAAAARMEKTQLGADGLAGQGKFAEAMHLLLLQSVGELRRRLCVSIAESLTSREILRDIPLSDEGRNAFADIVGRVEVSHFGARCPGEGDYAACRRSFDVLTRVLRQGGVS